ncbi:MAG: ParB/RepB/Spo0J family partition protein [Gammaproteobacteria bacterium]|nr:ParB/RepB/Spo0J family partition protein [Gammaproteobacteria bacterium]MBQ0839264.1 ParB/RepB/Spo0J family partition protein [Gammaproteobacteria bacterium]
MSGKKKGLGKGLDALLGGEMGAPLEQQGFESPSQQDKVHGLKELPVEFLQRGQYQPRKDMNPAALDELAESIRRQGIMQPIMVRPLAKDSYEIVAGERRWRAAQLAGLDTVPAIVKSITDEDAIALALIENIQREDLNAMEEALALTRLQEEFGYSQKEVAEAVGKPRSTVANLMRLTALQPEVALLLERGDIDMGHGRALLALQGSNQLEVARIVVGKDLSVRQTEALVRQWQNKVQTAAPIAAKNTDIQRLEQKLSEQLGAGVAIKHSNGGKGKMVISYNSLDELDGILTHIK